jgi:hypothetical protein
MKETKPWQTICFLMLLFLPIKIAAEIYISASILPYWEQQSFVPIQTSHILGCLVAILFYLAKNKRRDSPTRPNTRPEQALSITQ